MKKTVRKTLATILFAILSICLIFTVAMQTPANDVFADSVEGYNIYDIHQAVWPNGGYVNYLDVVEDKTEGYISFAAKQNMAASESEAGGSFIFRNNYMFFEKDVTYTVSAKIKTIPDEGSDMSKTWKISARAIVNGAVQTSNVVGKTLLSGDYDDWTDVSYSFKANATSSTGVNCFDICFAGFAEGDMVLLKDVKVIAPKSVVEKTNLVTGDLALTNPNFVKFIDKESVTEEGFGKVTKFAMKSAGVDGATASAVVVRANFAWQADVKYHISFFYKTECAASNSFSSAYAMIRSKDKTIVNVGSPTFDYSNAAGMKVNDGQWKMFNYIFDKSAATDQAGQASDCFDIMLNPFNPDDVIYIADLRIAVATCDTHTAEVEYVWNSDNTKCTASFKSACSVCGANLTETVDAVASDDTATCTEAGKITYTATFTNSAFTTQTKEVNTEAKGHTYGEATYVWATDNSTCTATKTCTIDGCEGIVTETVTATTREETGKTVYTATFTKSEFTAQTKEVTKQVEPEPQTEPQTKDEPKEEKGGCSGSIVESSAVIFLTMAVACVVVLLKKREER